MNQVLLIAILFIASLIALPTILAPRYALHASARARRVSQRFDNDATDKGAFLDEYHNTISATLRRIPLLVLAASASAFRFDFKEADFKEISDLTEYAKRNPWAKRYMAEAAALFVCAQFYGNPYNHRIWKLSMMAGFILWSLKRTKKLESTFSTLVASRELVRARKVDDPSGNLAHC